MLRRNTHSLINGVNIVEESVNISLSIRDLEVDFVGMLGINSARLSELTLGMAIDPELRIACALSAVDVASNLRRSPSLSAAIRSCLME